MVGEQIYLLQPSFRVFCHSFCLQLLTASFLQELRSPPGPHSLIRRAQEVGLKCHREQRRSSNGGQLLRWGGEEDWEIEKEVIFKLVSSQLIKRQTRTGWWMRKGERLTRAVQSRGKHIAKAQEEQRTGAYRPAERWPGWRFVSVAEAAISLRA